MKISDLIHLLQTTLPKSSPTPFSPSIHLFTAYVECKLITSLREMQGGDSEHMLSQENIESLQVLQWEFLETIWHSDHIPLHAPHGRLTALLCILAQALESMTGKSRYVFLFPTVDFQAYFATTTVQRMHDLQLTEFILSDDGSRPIDVVACLDAAVGDGMLKHTCLFDGVARELSQAEANRVIYHSEASKAYWGAIQAFIFYPHSAAFQQYNSIPAGIYESVQTRGGLLREGITDPQYQVTSTYGHHAEILFSNRVKQLPDLDWYTSHLYPFFTVFPTSRAKEEKQEEEISSATPTEEAEFLYASDEELSPYMANLHLLDDTKPGQAEVPRLPLGLPTVFFPSSDVAAMYRRDALQAGQSTVSSGIQQPIFSRPFKQ